jgi:hypothetical protein
MRSADVEPNLLLILALAGIVLGLALAAAMVARLVRVARRPELARAAVVPTATVTFAEAGPVELAIEGPQFTTKLGPLSYELVDPAGATVPLQKVWMRTSSSSFGNVRLSLHRLDVARPGAHTLRIGGIDPATDYADCAIVFVRPSGPGLVATIVALLASIGLAAGGAATVGALFVGSNRPSAPADPEPVAGPPKPTAHLATPTPAAPAAGASGGRRLASDPDRLRDGKAIVWPVMQMHVRVPAGWVVRKLTATELDLRHPTAPSTFLVARASPMPAGPSLDDFLQADVVRAQERLAAQRIDGWAVRRIGAVGGLQTLERRSGGANWQVVWTGYQPAELGSLSVTLVAGATAVDFARDEALLGAVVDSIRFE